MPSGVHTLPLLVPDRASAPRAAALAGQTRSATRTSIIVSAAVIVGVVLAGHGWSLRDGRFLDDHWHQAKLSTVGWSLSQLVAVTTISPDRFMHCWWQERSNCWEYVRPFSVVVMKLSHLLSGGSTVAQHAVNVLIHLATSLLVWRLCLRLTGHRHWSVVGGCLFGLYTHSMIPVAWLASQNALLQTLLTVAGLLLYIRASGLDLYAGPDEDRAARLAGMNSVPGLRVGAFSGVVACMVLGMFTRENAVVLPVFAWALDRAFGGRDHARARRHAHWLLALLALAFIAWRISYATYPVPDFYLRRPDGPGYVLWLLAKLMHYVCSAVWLTPMTIGPTGRFNPFSEVPGDCALMAAILGVMSLGYYCACREARGWWIWPLWILLAVLPVTPIMASPHSGYMAGVGFAIAMVLAPGLHGRLRPIGIGRWNRAVAVWFIFATLVYVPITRVLWNGLCAAENVTIAALAAQPPPAETKDVYFINLPFVNVYAPIQLGQDWGSTASAVRCNVLCYAPDLLHMEQPTRIEQLDNHRFRVSLERGRYFSGALGRYMIEAMRQRGAGRLHTGQRFAGDGFDVEITDADEAGVRRLTYIFREPLGHPRFRFYATTAEVDGAVVCFRDMPSGSPPVDVTPTPTPVTDPAAIEQTRRMHRDIDWFYAIRSNIAKATRTDLYFTGPPFPGPR